MRKPRIASITPKKGDTLSVNYNGKWHGTETIEFEYQWQDCTAALHRHRRRDQVDVRRPARRAASTA